MQQFFATSGLVEIRIQERLAEAATSHLAAEARGNRVSGFRRLTTALRNAFAAESASDLDFVPQLVDYPAHA